MRLFLSSLMFVGSIASAQVSVEVNLPSVQFREPPPLVVVQPGIQVVPDIDDEVFYVNGTYWTRRGPHWYRARHHRGGWVYVEPRRLPRTIVRFPPGSYRRWHAAGPPPPPAPHVARPNAVEPPQRHMARPPPVQRQPPH
ncbi:MAG: hypothetical protein JNG84_08635 [Archangium sp.]|nr:hypothetical protein [Archangium sp.]